MRSPPGRAPRVLVAAILVIVLVAIIVVSVAQAAPPQPPGLDQSLISGQIVP